MTTFNDVRLLYGFQTFLIIWNMFHVDSRSRSCKKVMVNVIFDWFQIDLSSKSFNKVRHRTFHIYKHLTAFSRMRIALVGKTRLPAKISERRQVLTREQS